MPATAAPVSLTKTPSSPFAATPQGRFAARIAGLWPTGLVLGLLLGWALWLSILMTHPLHPTRASALLDSVRGVGVEQWAFVEPRDNHFEPFPFLSDPMREEWEVAHQNPPVTPATKNSPAAQNGWIAWKDSDGTHVARLDGSTVTVTAKGDEGWSTHADVKDRWPSVSIELPKNAQVQEVADLWNGSRLLGPTWLVPAVSLLLALALLFREPRFRTRWGWFWMLCAPLGLGFVWMLLREQLFGARSNQGRRPGGWSSLLTSVLLFIPAQIILSGIIPRM